MGKWKPKKKNPETPKDVSGGGGKSGKTYHRSASTAFDKDMKIFISLAIEHKEEGNKLFKKRDHEGAMLRYGKAVNLLPKDHIDFAYLKTSIASCYMQMGLDWYQNAISECDLALEAFPRYSKALLIRSRCNEALNKLDFAFRDARTVLNMEPQNASANEIFGSVKKRLVDEGVDVDEMEKNFVNVQPVARLRKIMKERLRKNSGKDDEVKSNKAVVEVEMGDEGKSINKPNEEKSNMAEIDGKMGGDREVQKASFKNDKGQNKESGNKTGEETKLEDTVVVMEKEVIASEIVEVEACPICFEDVPQDERFTVYGCFHQICVVCMRQYLTNILQQRKPLICPNLGCKSELQIEDCNKIADSDQIALMIQLKAEESIEVSDRVYCPNPRCSFLLSARGLRVLDAALPGARKCVQCGLRFCINCKMDWHKKMICGEFQKTKAYKRSDTAVFDATARELGLKKCRKCHSTVERVEGCKRMTCVFCKYEFCYSCGNEFIKKKPTCKCATKVDKGATSDS